MTPVHERLPRRSPRRSWAAILALLGLAVAPASAQTNLPDLPALDLEVSAGSRSVELTWPEVDSTVGRRVTRIVRNGFGADSVSVELLGEYGLDCDYRLRVSKVPQDAGFNRRVILRYTIAENTSDIGAPLREGTVVVALPNVVYPFQTDIAGNLGVRVGGNINPQESPLGTIDATVTGLNTTSSVSTNYFVAALNSVSSLSDTLRVEVVGPVARPVPVPLPPSVFRTTLSVTSAAQSFPIQDGQTISFSEGSAAPGDTLFWSAKRLFAASGFITADLQAFEGYHVWRSDLPNVDDFSLLGEIRQCESKFDFVLVDGNEIDEISIRLSYDPLERAFHLQDFSVHDDFPYRYAVSTFDRGFLGNVENLTFEGPLTTTEKLYPAAVARNRASAAYVVPNPYSERADWQEGGGRKIVFANLPTQATIRIFTLSTDYVATLNHGPGEAGSTSPTSREWDLRSEAGRLIAPGIYIYYIEGTNQYDAGGGAMRSEGYQQTGKFMIAR